jgi:uncharacterized membrane protein YkvA (DUF1232 family)
VGTDGMRRDASPDPACTTRPPTPGRLPSVDRLEVLLAVVGGLLLLWAALLALLWRTRPPDLTVREALRLLPHLVRVVRRAADRSLPRGVRVRLRLLLGYLLSPVDLVPDIVPVLGYADDVVVALALRSVARTAGRDALICGWTG